MRVNDGLDKMTTTRFIQQQTKSDASTQSYTNLLPRDFMAPMFTARGSSTSDENNQGPQVRHSTFNVKSRKVVRKGERDTYTRVSTDTFSCSSSKSSTSSLRRRVPGAW